MRITRIANAVQAMVQGYQTRRLPEPPLAVLPQNNGGNTQPLMLWKLNARRDLMRMEMPDRWSDVTNDPLVPVYSPSNPVGVLPGPTTLRRVYRSRYAKAVADYGQAAVDANASAECLYLIIMNSANSDNFRGSDRGDVDGDGLREFHDNWGNPIQFVRWPAGFTVDHGGAIHTDMPDHHDWLKLSGDYELHPLVYSAGPDGVFDVNPGLDTSGNPMAYVLTAGILRTCEPDPTGNLVGKPLDLGGDGNLGHFDNIHSHALCR